MTAFVFTVFGIAQPQGSAKAFMPKGARFPIVTSDNPQLKGWRQIVAAAASTALRETGAGLFLEGPVRLSADFHLPRPKSLGVKERAHMTRPDVDKLARAIGDALTGVVWRDDSQIVQLQVAKAYARVGESPRAIITIEQLSTRKVG